MLADLAEMAIARCQRPFDPPLSRINIVRIERGSRARFYFWFQGENYGQRPKTQQPRAAKAEEGSGAREDRDALWGAGEVSR